MSLSTRSIQNGLLTSRSDRSTFSMRKFDDQAKVQRIRSRPPNSLEQVRRPAEREATRLNNTIEDIFEQHNPDSLAAEVDFVKLEKQLSEALNYWGITKVQKYANFCQQNFRKPLQPDLQESLKDLERVGPVFDKMTALLQGVEKRLHVVMTKKLARYCFSLAELCRTEITFVKRYEKNCSKYGADLQTEMKDLVHHKKSLDQCAFDLPSFISNGFTAMESIKKIRAVLNKLYYTVMEWVEEDRGYLDEIEDRISENTDKLSKKNSEYEEQNELLQSEDRTLEKLKIHGDTESERIDRLRRSLRKGKGSYEAIERKLEAMEQDDEEHKQQKTAAIERLNQLEETKKANKYLQNASPIWRKITWAQRDFDTADMKLAKADNTRQALLRQLDRLQHQEQTDQEELEKRERRLRLCHREIEEYKDRRKRTAEQLTTVDQERQQLHQELQDLKFLRTKKSSLSSLRELHSFGKVMSPRKEPDKLEQAFEAVAGYLGPDWHSFYWMLPFEPVRSATRRQKDINILEGVCNQKDLPPKQQALLALQKWRQFYRKCSLEELIASLKQFDRRDAANYLTQFLT